MKKVFVGISGGVDSSVSAYFLKKEGYDVTGVFIKVWQPDFVNCNWKEEMRDAMRVCAKLGIPFLLCDLEKEYKEGVIDYMLREYKKGRTPNPDVMCNKEVKFKAFLKFALKNGADYIATGHYAQNIKKDGLFHLLAGKDKAKDQSYFLWNLNQEILEKTLFPIGNLNKKEVRKVAQKIGLNTAVKKDSQGLCFVGNINIKDFLKQFIAAKPGDVLDTEGDVIGKHQGAILYTIGERHNIEIFQKKPKEKIYYVVDKDIDKNIITVSNEKINKNDRVIKLTDCNFIRTKELVGKKVRARSRYRQPLQQAKIININDSNLTIKFEKDQESITPGQSIVFYRYDECLGGGIIS